MINKKGFVLIETIIVMSVLLIGMIILYSNYNKMIINSSKVNYYDNVEDIYAAYYAYKYVNDLTITPWNNNSIYEVITNPPNTDTNNMSKNKIEESFKGIFDNLNIETIYYFSKGGFEKIFDENDYKCGEKNEDDKDNKDNENQLLCFDGTTINYLRSIENKNDITKCDDSNNAPCITIVKINRDGHYYFAKYEAYNDNKIKIDDINDEFDKEKNFDFTGSNQIFIVPKTGLYELEVWGAQGGSYTKGNALGGYGAYSVGEVWLHKGDYLFVVVGGKGTDGIKNKEVLGGYNGGGNGYSNNNYFVSSGGGASHIALRSGILSDLTTNDILIVAGGGGGGAYQNGNNYGIGGSGGGINGISATNIVITNKVSSEKYLSYGGTQTGGGTPKEGIISKNGDFGLGAGCIKNTQKIYCSGGGGGYYGGGSAINAAGGSGGSGYIGNNNLTDKAMYCFGCEESGEESTKTVAIPCHNETPTENCAKEGNGYARITYKNSEE